MATQDEVLDIIQTLAEYYSKTLNNSMMDVYVRALASVPVDALHSAVDAHVTNSQYFPKVNELMALVRNAQEGYANKLDAMIFQLEEADEIDVSAWRRCIAALEEAGRNYRADGLRKRLAYYEALTDSL